MARNKAATRGGTSIIHDDIAFDLDRLFDKYNMDHIPANKHLEGFEHRDLPHIKHYKAAVNIFGGPISRKRTIIAPPMETPLKRRLGLYMNKRQDPVPPVLNSELKPVAPPPKVMSSTEVLDQEEKEKEASYKQWFSERQALRANLDGMGLSEALLERKADKSELEKRVQNQLRAARLWKPESPPPPEPVPEEKELPVVPSMKVPVPTALQTLDKFLTEKKIRLIDLFRNADTNNDWKLTKSELMAAVKKYQIPLTLSDVEDLMVTLDNNFDELLDFKEVSQGLAALKMERRASRRHDNSTASSARGMTARSSDKTLTPGNLSSPPSKLSSAKSRELNTNQNNNEAGWMNSQRSAGDMQREIAAEYSANEIGEVETEKKGDSGSSSSTSVSRSGSAHRSRSATPSSLEPPPPDLREECRMGSSAEEMLELRKHDKTILERARQKKWPWPEKKGTHEETPGVIRIGHKDVDNHCMESTLEGEVGELLNQFRRSCLREYFHAIRLCQEKGVVLTPELLDRVLLYPAEMPKHHIIKKVALPKGPLSGLEEHFARPPKKPKTPPEIRHKDKMKRSKNGSLMIDVRHMYPPMARVAPVVTKENLSTGRALVSRRSDIWMTFEEYDKYTKHLPRRYKKLNIKTRPDSEEGDASSSNITGYTSVSTSSNQEPFKRYQLDSEKFWPGYMLDKLALYEPSPDQPAPWSQGSHAIFHHTGQPKRRGNTGHVRVMGPPVNQDGRILSYGIDKRRALLPSHSRK
ncbi:EF-hand calcium-binding domain-containing protein 12-like isoform X2 [Babylonia areolata]|uniref:EF-hand calcium-binding domain-containing protein 12-like isoform X2 n=1 Tax=Babylonia areolata TaxID=304850 RepID=UPI003FCF2C6E